MPSSLNLFTRTFLPLRKPVDVVHTPLSDRTLHDAERASRFAPAAEEEEEEEEEEEDVAVDVEGNTGGIMTSSGLFDLTSAWGIDNVARSIRGGRAYVALSLSEEEEPSAQSEVRPRTPAPSVGENAEKL